MSTHEPLSPHLWLRHGDCIHSSADQHMQGQTLDKSAAQFLVDTINAAPGEITILALAACTNVAMAMKLDPELPAKWKEVVILGGAFQVSGNVSPAAEANIMGDPEAADWVVSHGRNIYMVGLDVTHACSLSGEQLQSLSGAQLCSMSRRHLLAVLWCS